MIRYVLIVDDEKATLIAYKKLLRLPGIEIDTAETLEDATDSLKKRKYSVVISDLRLTGTSAMEGLVILKVAKEINDQTKVILITAYGNPGIREKAYDLGASFYIEKPVPTDNLRRAMVESLGEAS